MGALAAAPDGGEESAKNGLTARVIAQADERTYVEIAFILQRQLLPCEHRTLGVAAKNVLTQRVRMARRSVPPPKPKTPILTVGQKRRRIERLRTCVTKLEAFDLQKARNRAPAVLELEAAIDKALSSAFGYGTSAHLRYSDAATLDPSPLLTNVTVRAPVSPPLGGPTRRDAKVEETRHQFSVNKARAIALLQNAIGILEEEIGDAGPVVAAPQKSGAAVVIASDEPSQVSPRAEVHTPSRRALSGFAGAVRRHVGRWWRGHGR
jgi:hypothetical protein